MKANEIEIVTLKMKGNKDTHIFYKKYKEI